MRKYLTRHKTKSRMIGTRKGWALFSLLCVLVTTVPVVAQPGQVLKEETVEMCRSHLLPVDLNDVIGVAIPAGSGKWYDSSTNQPVSNIFIPGAAQGFYSFYFLVEAKDALCELEIGEGYKVNIRINDVASPEGGQEQRFCATPGKELTLQNVTVTGEYLAWFDQEVGGVVLNKQTPLVDGQTYYAALLSPGCGESTNRLAVTVTLDVVPDIVITDPGPQARSFDLNDLLIIDRNNASGQITFHSKLPVNGTDMSTQITGATLSSTQTIFVMKVSGGGCYDVEKITIVIEECNFEVTAKVTDATCKDKNSGEIQVSVVNHTQDDVNFSYLWNTGETSPNIAGLAEGTYKVIITTDNSCSPVEREYSVVNWLDTPPEGEARQLFCYIPGKLPVIADLIVTGDNIRWYNQSEGGEVLDKQMALEDGRTYYASQTVSGCGESRRRLAVVAWLLVEPDIFVENPGIQNIEYDLNMIAIQDLNNAEGEITYHENIPAHATDMSNRLDNLLITTSKEIFVMKATANGCFDIEKILIEINESRKCNYELVAEISDVLCFGDNTGKISLEVVNHAGDEAQFSYNWSNGSVSSINEGLAAGVYTVTISSDKGCEPIAKSFTIYQPDVLKLVMDVVGASAPKANDAKATANVSGGTPEYSYQWNDDLNQVSVTATNLKGGEYKVLVTDANGCQIEGNALIKGMLFIPEGFSPNGDGTNEYFEILGLEDYPEAEIKIYNRWNNLVYSKKGYGNQARWGITDAWWDGRSNSKWRVGNDLLPAATYIYILRLRPDKTDVHKGIIFINR